METSFVDELSTQISGKISQTVMFCIFLRKGFGEGSGIKLPNTLYYFLPVVGKSVVGVESNLDSISLDKTFNSASIADCAI